MIVCTFVSNEQTTEEISLLVCATNNARGSAIQCFWMSTINLRGETPFPTEDPSLRIHFPQYQILQCSFIGHQPGTGTAMPPPRLRAQHFLWSSQGAFLRHPRRQTPEAALLPSTGVSRRWPYMSLSSPPPIRPPFSFWRFVRRPDPDGVRADGLRRGAGAEVSVLFPPGELPHPRRPVRVR